jgi:hypothetical protein
MACSLDSRNNISLSVVNIVHPLPKTLENSFQITYLAAIVVETTISTLPAERLFIYIFI